MCMLDRPHYPSALRVRLAPKLIYLLTPRTVMGVDLYGHTVLAAKVAARTKHTADATVENLRIVHIGQIRIT